MQGRLAAARGNCCGQEAGALGGSDLRGAAPSVNGCDQGAEALRRPQTRTGTALRRG